MVIVGREVAVAGASEVVYSVEEREYSGLIQAAHNQASHALLTLIVNELNLIDRLR